MDRVTNWKAPRDVFFVATYYIQNPQGRRSIAVNFQPFCTEMIFVKFRWFSLKQVAVEFEIFRALITKFSSTFREAHHAVSSTNERDYCCKPSGKFGPTG